MSISAPIPIFLRAVMIPKSKKNIYKGYVNSNVITDILDSIGFRIDDALNKICLDSKRFNYNSNIECLEKPLDAYRCSANKTVFVNTFCEIDSF